MSDRDYRKRVEKSTTRLLVAVVVVAVLCLTAYAAKAADIRIGHKAVHSEWVCAEKDVAEVVMQADVDEGFDVATMSINLLAAFGLCANVSVEMTPKKVVKTAKVPRGTLSIVEVDVGGATLYVITVKKVVDGLPI